MKDYIVIPTYNEVDNISAIIDGVFKAVPGVYIMVVDDNSPDGTAGAVEEMMKKEPRLSIIKRPKKEGLGRAYVQAFKKIIADMNVRTVVEMDADFSHNPSYLPKFLEKRREYDLVVGSRNVLGGGTIGWEFWRKVLSRGGNFYARVITGLPVRDSTGGFNAISVDFLRRIDLDSMGSSGYAFQIELKYLLYKAGARIFEYPIIFRNRAGGESKMSGHIIREGILAPWRMRKKQ